MSKLPNGIYNVSTKLTEAVGDLACGKGRIKSRLTTAVCRRLTSFDASNFPEDQGIIFGRIKKAVDNIDELSEEEAVAFAGLLQDLNSKINIMIEEAK